MRSRSRRLWRPISRVLRLPLKGLIALYRWLTASLRRRRLRHLLQGLPALFVFIAVAVLAGVVRKDQDDLVNEYRSAAHRAVTKEDYTAGRVYYERVNLSEDQRPFDQYNLALSLDRLGQYDRARAIMQLLAPSDSTGYAQAHLWLAEQMFQDKEILKSPARWPELNHHLRQAERGNMADTKVDLLLAQYYGLVGNPRAAVPYLEKAARSDAGLYFELADLCSRLGMREAAREASEKADDYYRRRVEESPEDDQARLRWASVVMNLGDFEQAVRILQKGLALKPEGPYGKAIAAALIAQYDRGRSRGEVTPAYRLKLLEIALRFDPESQSALTRLLDFVGTTPEAGDQARELLQNLLVGGYGSAFAHFTLGCLAWRENEQETAVWHLERAYKLDAELGPVANNLAWVLAHREPADSDRALRIMNSVVERWPQVAVYRDTRGQILAKMKRWEDALDDLEAALPGMPRDRQLHEALAEIYRHLNKTSLSEKHTQILQHLDSQADGINRDARGPE